MTIRVDAAAQVRSYLLFVGIGSTAVFGLLVLSTQSALSVIQLEKIQRSYTLLILASCITEFYLCSYNRAVAWLISWAR